MMEHERDARPAAGAVYGLAGAVALIVGLAALVALDRPARYRLMLNKRACHVVAVM